MLDGLQLTGRSRTHVIHVEELRADLHRDVVQPLMEMRAAAARDGIDIAPCSAFRSFDSQLGIWNQKYRGERILYDSDGQQIAHDTLGEAALIDCILGWSALPGGSRHHWGTDVDVIDCNVTATGYKPELLPEEYAPGGEFDMLNQWLDRNMKRFDFFRPYRRHRGGVHVEPWHLSYAPVAVSALDTLSPELLAEAIESSEVLGKQMVLDRLDEIYQRYIANVDGP